jgi:hypothetical protein
LADQLLNPSPPPHIPPITRHPVFNHPSLLIPSFPNPHPFCQAFSHSSFSLLPCSSFSSRPPLPFHEIRHEKGEGRYCFPSFLLFPSPFLPPMLLPFLYPTSPPPSPPPPPPSIALSSTSVSHSSSSSPAPSSTTFLVPPFLLAPYHSPLCFVLFQMTVMRVNPAYVAWTFWCFPSQRKPSPQQGRLTATIKTCQTVSLLLYLLSQPTWAEITTCPAPLSLSLWFPSVSATLSSANMGRNYYLPSSPLPVSVLSLCLYHPLLSQHGQK